MTSFLRNLMHCTCLLCGTQAVGERVNDLDVLEKDSGWFGAVSWFRAFAASCQFLQGCRHSTGSCFGSSCVCHSMSPVAHILHPDKLLEKTERFWCVRKGFGVVWDCVTGSCLGSHNGSYLCFQWHARYTLTNFGSIVCVSPVADRLVGKEHG